MKKLLLVQIDGLSHPVLTYALEQGLMPYVKKLVQSGYTAQETFCGLPSTTPASQMSILYGVSNLIVGFRFVNRETGSFFIPTNAAAVESMEKIAASLRSESLAAHTASACTIFSGARESFSLGKVSLERSSRPSLLRIFSHYSNPLTTLFLFTKIGVVALLEYLSLKKEHKEEISPRTYLHNLGTRLLEETTTADLGLAFSKRLMSEDNPVVYVNFAGYDTIAHHTGPRSRSALFCLSLTDMYVAKLLAFNQEKSCGYECVVFSDHGQTDSVSFSSVYKKSLAELIGEWYQGKIISDYHSLFESLNPKADMHMFFSGGLALLYTSPFDKPKEKKDTEALFPELFSRLSSHRAIAFAVVRKGGKPILISKGVESNLTKEAIAHAAGFIKEGDAEHVAREVQKLIDAKHGADAYLFSSMVNEKTTITFEDSRGAHGGVGGNQTASFFLSNSIRLPSGLDNLSQVHDILLAFIQK